jgi:hypothetical protein
MNGLIKRASIVWLFMMAAETLHGVVREVMIAPLIGDFRARQVAVLSGTILIFLISFVFTRWLKGSSVKDFLLVGGLWVLLTLGFEILLGRFAIGMTWARIFSDYDLSNGGLMAVGLLAMCLTPLVTAKLWDEI